MFASDRDLKKPANSRRGASQTTSAARANKVNNSVSPAPHRDAETTTHSIASSLVSNGSRSDAADIVEQARLERQRREALRTHAARALRLQAWWRGRRSARATSSGALAALGQRVGDLERVAAMLRASKGIDLVPPLQVTHQLVAMLLFLGPKISINKVLSEYIFLSSIYLTIYHLTISNADI
jgi:hypothetical protein